MNKLIHCILVYLLTIIVISPANSRSESTRNSYDLLSQCLGNIRPSEESNITPIFDKITRNTNPKLTNSEISLLKNWLETQKNNIQLIDNAIAVDSIQFPLIDVSTMELPMFSEYRSLLSLKLIQAQIHLSDNNNHAALLNVLDAIKLGRMVRYGKNSSLFHNMIGISLEGNGVKWLQNILCTKKYSNKTLQLILRIIPNQGIIDKAFIASMEDELNDFVIPNIENYSDQIEPIITQLKMDRLSIYDRKDSIAMANKQFEQIINNAKTPWTDRNKDITSDNYKLSDEIITKAEELIYMLPSSNFSEFDINNQEVVAKWKEIELLANGKKNLLGRVLLSSTPLFEAYLQRSVELRTKINIARTFVALKIFQNNSGQYPEELNQLIETKILNHPPLDLFSSRPIQYSSANHKLWSVGSDGNDNKSDQENDIVFSCELKNKSQDTKPCN